MSQLEDSVKQHYIDNVLPALTEVFILKGHLEEDDFKGRWKGKRFDVPETIFRAERRAKGHKQKSEIDNLANWRYVWRNHYEVVERRQEIAEKKRLVEERRLANLRAKQERLSLEQQYANNGNPRPT